jgi:hypothetical protein
MGSPQWLGRRHREGTRVQYRTGYIYVKTEEGMISEARRIWELHRGELSPGDRVFHLNGDRTNNNIRNLSKVHFNATKFTMLKESRILWEPPIKPVIRVIDKKTGRILVNS